MRKQIIQRTTMRKNEQLKPLPHYPYHNPALPGPPPSSTPLQCSQTQFHQAPSPRRLFTRLKLRKNGNFVFE